MNPYHLKRYERHTDFLRDAQWLQPLEMSLPKTPLITSFKQPIVALGSCFAQHLHGILNQYKFNSWRNESSCAHFNTETLRNVLRAATHPQSISEEQLFLWNDSRLSPQSTLFSRLRYWGDESVEHIINESKRLALEFRGKLASSSVVLITLGNARVVRLKESATALTNANGISEELLNYHLLSVAELEEQLTEILELIASLNGSTPQILFTVSPQRYAYKEALTAPNPPVSDSFLNKSLLRVACESITQQYSNAHYFPSYEMVVDELRQYESLSTYDHRHINTTLTPKYVAKRFIQTYASDRIERALPLIEDLPLQKDMTEQCLKQGLSNTDVNLLEQWQDFLNSIEELNGEIDLEFLRQEVLNYTAAKGIVLSASSPLCK